MNWLKDPLIAFLIAGCAIFLLAGFFESDESYEIQVQESDIQRLSDQWQMQMRRPPADEELKGLVEQWLKEEIYYREAQRLGLETNDTIVRRRLVQKLTFLTEDIATAVALDDNELKTFYEENLAAYRVPPRYSFQHRYFSKDRRDDARSDAAAAVQDETSAGDPFMLQRQYVQRSQREIGDLFGRQFASALIELKPGENWQGPLESAYGWHAVKLTEAIPERTEPFAQVIERVRTDAQQAKRQEANDAYYADLRSRYNITYAAPPAPAS